MTHTIVIKDDDDGVQLVELERSFETRTLALKLIFRVVEAPNINIAGMGVSLTPRQALELAEHLQSFAVRCAQ